MFPGAAKPDRCCAPSSLATAGNEAGSLGLGADFGTQGRVRSRDRQPFTYDPSGRRTEDDRFVYRWSWRGELDSVTVKSTWPGDEIPSLAGRQVRYEYDAFGRQSQRLALGPLPEGETDDATRPLVERRALVWEGQSLLFEEGYGGAGQLRWRRSYVPGPSGLDDAVQVAVEVVSDPSSPYTGTSRLYTYLRDEQGTVVGLVAEEEGTDPTQPPIPVRYLYTPYGEAHVERALSFARPSSIRN